jgi:hypothetical protein
VLLENFEEEISSVQNITNELESVKIEGDCSITLTGRDSKILNEINSQILLYNDESSVESGIKTLSLTIHDFPLEFYFQSKVFESITKILPKLLKSEHGFRILKLMRLLLAKLHKCSYNEDNTNIPTKRYINMILQCLTICVKDLNENSNGLNLSTDIQTVLNQIFIILLQMNLFMSIACDLYINDLLNVLAEFARKLRKNYEKCIDETSSSQHRLNYLLIIFIINSVVAKIDAEIIRKRTDNNIWEYESDVSLLDFSFQFSYAKIYDFVKNNRMDVLQYDADMMLLINIEKFWKPVVKLFQNWKSMSDEEIIYVGLEALETLKIHRNTDLITILYKVIERNGEKLSEDVRLREAAEQITMRLLSTDVLEIQSYFYALARNSIQKKMANAEEESGKSNLCSVFGIPISTEIITEILCFGSSSVDNDVRENAKIILFAILRSKVIFPNHWNKLLDVIKPILPLMPCIFCIDQKMIFFAFDIFHQHSGLEEHELNQAYARFLFCGNAKVREMAKTKLLECLGDENSYTHDLIEIIPDNFCITPDSLITELQMPDNSIGYNHEAYESTVEVLKNDSDHEEEIIQSVLLQLSVLMNSAEMCEKSHNDNLWVYVISLLNDKIESSNNKIIRKLVIDVIYKWIISVPSFRIYLSNEPLVLKYLINTLIYFQDDMHTKKSASTLLFLLLFSDFIVKLDKSISLPSIISSLKCPFRFNTHWNESPFSKKSHLEMFYETLMDIDNEGNIEVQNISLQYMRCTFAREWFKDFCLTLFKDWSPSSKVTENLYYTNLHKSTLNVSNNLLLLEKDFKMIKNTAPLEIMSGKIVRTLTSITICSQITEAAELTKSILMLSPNSHLNEMNELAQKLEDVIEMYLSSCSSDNARASMLQKYLNFYQSIAHRLDGNHCVKILQKLIKAMSGSVIDESEFSIADIFETINLLLVSCKKLPKKREVLAKNLPSNQMSNFMEKILRKLIKLLENARSFSDVSSNGLIEKLLESIRNLFNIFPITLDDSLINSSFDSILMATKTFIKSKRADNVTSFVGVHYVYNIFEILCKISSLAFKIELKSYHYVLLFLWLMEEHSTNKALILELLSNLLNRSDKLSDFCEKFESTNQISFESLMLQMIYTHNLRCPSEQKSVASLIGNFIDYGKDVNFKTAQCNQKTLALTFINHESTVLETSCYLVRKMIQNNMPEVSSVVQKNRILEQILSEKRLELVDIVVLCYTYNDLKDFARNVIHNMNDDNLMSIVSSVKHANDDEKHIARDKRINKNCLSVLTVLAQSTPNVNRILGILEYNSKIFEQFSLAIYDGLMLTNQYNELMFYMNFLLLFGSKTNSKLFYGAHPNTLLSGKLMQKLRLDFEKSDEKYAGKHFINTQFVIDVFLLQAINIFDYCIYSKYSCESECQIYNIFLKYNF